MYNPRLSIRYAQALFDLSAERGEVEAARKDMELLLAVCNENVGLRQMLSSPVINADKKISVMRALFSEKISKLSMAFVEIIIRKRRESLLFQIAGKFGELFLRYMNIKTARVISAVPLQADVRGELLTLLEKQTGSEIILEEEVNTGIIGGLIVKIENRLFDDSIRKKLQNLRKEFSVNVYTREI